MVSKRWLLFLLLLTSTWLVGITTANARTTDYAKTRYPIVLVHGFFGFDDIVGVDLWHRVPAGLRASGATVYTVNVSQANSTELRGEQLIEQLDNLRALYGHTKFNLYGHSHGGPTTRYAASVRPDLVASVTSVGGTHFGSKVADLINGAAPDDTIAQNIIKKFGNSLAQFVALISGSPGNPQDIVDSLKSLSTSGAIAFNARHPQGMPTTDCGNGPAIVNGVRYYSYGGTSVLTNVLDISDIALGATSVVFLGEANDGLVGRCSTHWGTVVRDNYTWNHMDQINQTLGLRGILAPDPISVYKTHANRLKNLGL